MYIPPPDLDWKTYAVVVGQRVKALQTDWEWPQEELAERAGISRNQIQNIERGHGTGVNGRVTNMSMEHVYRLAYAPDVPPIVLLPDVQMEVVPRCRAAEHREPMSSLMHRAIEIDVASPKGLRLVKPGESEG